MKHPGLLLAAWLGVLGCSEHPPDVAPQTSPGERPLVVYATNEPLRYFAERIGGEEVRAVLPCPRGVDPADWSPDGDTVAAYQRADLVLLNGGGYAAWVARASLPRATGVDTSSAFTDRLLAAPSTPTHRHGPDGAHAPNGRATGTWLDPTLARRRARAIATALARARPPRAAQFEARLAELDRDLEDLDLSLVRATRPWVGEPILFSHPVYAYFERRYELNGRSLHWEPEHVPNAEAWSRLRELLESHPARLMVWEAEPEAETKRRLRELDVDVAVVPARGDSVEAADWLARMRAAATRLRERTP